MGQDELLRRAAEAAIAYLEAVDERPVRPDPAADLGPLGGPLPRGPTDPEHVLRLLDDVAAPATMAMAGPRFFGWVVGGSYPVALAADWLTSAWDQNAMAAAATPGTVALEAAALRWVVEATGLPEGTWGAFATGTTMAHVAALGTATTAVLGRAGWDPVADGLFGAPPVTVVVGDEVHPSLLKALGILGLGRDRVVRVPVDGQGRLRAEMLPVLEPPAILCLQAGNVDTGAFDPMAEVVDAAREVGAWVHVDGAFGFWAAASPAFSHLTVGMERADSWATDAHKYLNVPYDAGIVLVRDASALERAMSVSAAYLPPGEIGRDPVLYSLELSRRARGVPTWAVLRTIGRSGVAELVERTCALARRFADGVRAAGFEVLNEVVLNQVLVSFGDAATTARVVQEVQAEGTLYAGPTVWQGRTAMRVSVSSWRTTEADIDRSVAAVERCAEEVKRTAVAGVSA
jgi:glutamate/tyrosine decarboxylase-like PLP-dependent enzyme